MSEKSRSKQDTILLEERIEKIRKKNEEIKRRHLEVEADKQNAAKLNALVQITSASEDWPIGGRSPPPPSSRNQGTSRPRRSEPYRSHQNNSSNGSSAKTYCFGEGDGPPPDPKYKFLADSERDSEKNNSDRRQSRPHRGRGNSRGIPRERFVQQPSGGLQKSHRESEQPHPEYEAWRAERIRIDNDRINRQKTAEGQWRREWDHEKITQEEDERLPARGSKSGGPRRSNNWSTNFNQHTNQDYNTPKENHLGSLGSQMSERERGGHGSGTQRTGRGSLRGRRFIQPQHESLTGNVIKNEGNASSHPGRNVVSVGESIKISVSNDPTPVVKRVKVNAPIVGGTGRVGPRQKIRVSYSSQSEDEAPHSRTVEIYSNRVNVLSDSGAPNHSVSTASSKPPLPPSSGYKAEAPRPKRQRIKRVEHRKRGERKDSDDADESRDKNDSSEKGNESGGDDSWEDVTTTSGNESACEEMSPHNKSEVVPDSVYDEKVETCGSLNDTSNSESCITVTNVNQSDERNESRTSNETSVSQDITGCDENMAVTSDNVQSEFENNLVDKVINHSSSEIVAVNGSVNELAQETVDYGSQTDLKNESKENDVAPISFEEKPEVVQVDLGDVVV